MMRLEPDLMIYAGEEQRAGQEDILLIAVLKFELMVVRLVGLGMPLAYVKGDIEQGFPSARNMLLLAAAWRAGPQWGESGAGLPRMRARTSPPQSRAAHSRLPAVELRATEQSSPL